MQLHRIQMVHNPVLTNSGTTIKVFEGVHSLDFTTGTAANGEYTISRTNTGTATLGAINGNGTDTVTVVDGTAMSTDQVVISYAISGKRSSVSCFYSKYHTNFN